MATLYSDLGTKQNNAATGASGGFAANALTTLEVTPTNRTLTPKYTMVGTEAAADIIRIIKVPKGVKIIARLSGTYTRTGGLAVTATITVGDDGGGSNPGYVTEDVDRYSTALNVAAAGADTFTGGVAEQTPFVTTAETWITATFATLSTPTAGGILQFFLVLSQDN